MEGVGDAGGRQGAGGGGVPGRQGGLMSGNLCMGDLVSGDLEEVCLGMEGGGLGMEGGGGSGDFVEEIGGPRGRGGGRGGGPVVFLLLEGHWHQRTIGLLEGQGVARHGVLWCS